MNSSDPISSMAGEEFVVLPVVGFEIDDGMAEGLFHAHIPAFFLPNQAVFFSKHVPVRVIVAVIVTRVALLIKDENDCEIDPLAQQGFSSNDDFEAVWKGRFPFFERHGGELY